MGFLWGFSGNVLEYHQHYGNIVGYNGRFLSHGGIPVVIHGYMMMTLFFFRGGGVPYFRPILYNRSHRFSSIPNIFWRARWLIAQSSRCFCTSIFSLGWSQPACPRIGLREDQQEATIFRGKNHGISCKVSLQPIYRLSKSLHFWKHNNYLIILIKASFLMLKNLHARPGSTRESGLCRESHDIISAVLTIKHIWRFSEIGVPPNHPF